MPDEVGDKIALEIVQCRLDALHQNLVNANVIPGLSELAATRLALAGVLEFLKFFPAMRAEIAPLESLFQSLSDVARGVDAPLFKPVNVPANRGADTDRERTVRAACVAAIELLRQSGMGVNDAIAHVQRKLDDAKIRLGREKPKPITESRLENWRGRASKNGGDNLSAKAVEAICADEKAHTGWPPTPARAAEAADDLITALKN